jgi:hypothetical protein
LKTHLRLWSRHFPPSYPYTPTPSFADVVSKAKVVVWNGPMGVFEFDNYANGTKA